MKIQLAGCMIYDKNGNLLLLHRYSGGFDHWELPGGKIEKDESPQQAAIRELKEELDVTVEITAQVGETDFSDKDGEFHYFWFIAQIVNGLPAINEPHKFDSWRYIAINDLDQLSLSANMQKLKPLLKAT